LLGLIKNDQVVLLKKQKTKKWLAVGFAQYRDELPERERERERLGAFNLSVTC